MDEKNMKVWNKMMVNSIYGMHSNLKDCINLSYYLYNDNVAKTVRLNSMSRFEKLVKLSKEVGYPIITATQESKSTDPVEYDEYEDWED